RRPSAIHRDRCPPRIPIHRKTGGLLTTIGIASIPCSCTGVSPPFLEFLDRRAGWVWPGGLCRCDSRRGEFLWIENLVVWDGCGQAPFPLTGRAAAGKLERRSETRLLRRWNDGRVDHPVL